jgi:hypothetical protein
MGTIMQKMLAFACAQFFVALPVISHAEPHNVVLFVGDGLRPGIVNETTAPPSRLS